MRSLSPRSSDPFLRHDGLPTRLAAATEALRAGTWLTAERLRLYPLLIGGALALAIVLIVATAHGSLDRWHRPLGVDFSGIWIAGEAVRAGHAAQPYDNAAHAAAQVAAFGPSGSYLPWPYPPYLLAVAALLAGLPYLAALGAWQGGTLLLYLTGVLTLAGVRRPAPGPAPTRHQILVGALAFPAVAVNIFHGQNGFLSAGLLALGAALLDERPVIGGVTLALLAYKPQFALAVPIAVMAGGYWRAAIAGAVTLAAMTFGTWLAFGMAPWDGFFASLSFTRHVILEQGGLESWKLQSAFAAVRLLGGPLLLAYAIQAAVTLFVLATLVRLWHGDADLRLKGAALIVACLLASPYAVDYDLVILGPALAALVALGCKRGFLPWEKSLLAAAWLMPLAARVVAMSLHVPLALATMLGLYVFILRRASGAERGQSYVGHDSAAGRTS